MAALRVHANGATDVAIRQQARGLPLPFGVLSPNRGYRACFEMRAQVSEHPAPGYRQELPVIARQDHLAAGLSGFLHESVQGYGINETRPIEDQHGVLVPALLAILNFPKRAMDGRSELDAFAAH